MDLPNRKRDSRARTRPHWALLELPRPALSIVMGTNLLAATLAASAWLRAGPIPPRAWLQFFVLIAMAAIQAQLTGRVQVVRRYLAADRAPIANVTAVWALPAALTLPPALAVSVNVVLMIQALAWSARRRISMPHRVVFNGAAGALATLAASAVSTTTGTRAGFTDAHWQVLPVVGALFAIAAYAIVNTALVLAAMRAAAGPASLGRLLPSRENATFEGVTLALGVVLAALLGPSLWITPSVIAILLIAQRSVVTGQLKAEADLDSKTGLLAAGAWRRAAEVELRRAERNRALVSVLLIDLDHFKTINDQHGHLTGDAVLAEVGSYLRRELRGYDAVGRFGGEEFTAILPDTGVTEAARIAARIRAGIAALSTAPVPVTASIGLAGYPQDGPDLATLFQAADAALYVAKQAGRNRVEVFRATAPA